MRAGERQPAAAQPPTSAKEGGGVRGGAERRNAPPPPRGRALPLGFVACPAPRNVRRGTWRRTCVANIDRRTPTASQTDCAAAPKGQRSQRAHAAGGLDATPAAFNKLSTRQTATTSLFFRRRAGARPRWAGARIRGKTVMPCGAGAPAGSRHDGLSPPPRVGGWGRRRGKDDMHVDMRMQTTRQTDRASPIP